MGQEARAQAVEWQSRISTVKMASLERLLAGCARSSLAEGFRTASAQARRRPTRRAGARRVVELTRSWSGVRIDAATCGSRRRAIRSGTKNMARLERFELPTPWFVAKYSIQLSYRRAARGLERGP